MTATLTSKTEVITVKRIVLHSLRVPLLEPFRISNGAVAEKEAILIELLAEDKTVGWGEASPMSGTFYSGDTPESVWDSLTKSLIPAVLNAGEIHVRRFYEEGGSQSTDPFARAGIEGALWDAYAKTEGLPLWKLLGGKPRSIASGVAIGIYDDVGELLERVERYIAHGYQRVKIKIEPGWDVEAVAAVRARFPELPLMVDANAAYTLADKAIFRELDKYDLLMIEQPLGREAHADAGELQHQLRTPLCADESAECIASLKSLIENEAARIINIKIQRVGGLSAAQEMLKVAGVAGLECWVGTMPELGVASAHGLHFATLDGISYPTDIEASARWYVDDVVAPAIEIDGRGLITLPEGPGMGYRVLREKLERYSVAMATFGN